ncbi:protein containing Fibronectin-binding A, partial [mine drainage metagenome]
MEIEIDFTKNAQQNANDYYNRAKKLESKREGAKEAVSALEKKLKDEKKREDERESSKAAPIKKAEKRWYEKFHWFFTSGGKLVVGGRDA